MKARHHQGRELFPGHETLRKTAVLAIPVAVLTALASQEDGY